MAEHHAPDFDPSATPHMGMSEGSVRSGDTTSPGSLYIMFLLWHLVHLGFHFVVCP